MDVPSYFRRPFEYVPHPSDDDLIRKGKYDERARIRREQAGVIADMRGGLTTISSASTFANQIANDWADRLEAATRDA